MNIPSFCTKLASFVFVGVVLFAPLTLSIVYGQPSASGDMVCGGSASTKCTPQDVPIVVGNFLSRTVIPIGIIVMTLWIFYNLAMAFKAHAEGNPSALKDVKGKIFNRLIALLMLTLIASGILPIILRSLGVDGTFLRLLGDAFVPHAYAQSEQYLQSPVGSTTLYDFLLVVFRLFVRFFVYPAVVFMWVYTGFSFVAAQGRPEALTKAKSLLLWATAITIVIFVIEGFLFALRNTVNSIVPARPTPVRSQASPTGTLDGRVAPQPGQTGASCQTSAGAYGVIDTTGACAVGGRR
jgi:hypothetical protein